MLSTGRREVSGPAFRDRIADWTPPPGSQSAARLTTERTHRRGSGNFRRSPYFALAYAANDVVLIVLWILAARENISYLSVIICFVMFLVNDLYGYFSWKRMEKRQMAAA